MNKIRFLGIAPAKPINDNMTCEIMNSFKKKKKTNRKNM